MQFFSFWFLPASHVFSEVSQFMETAVSLEFKTALNIFAAIAWVSGLSGPLWLVAVGLAVGAATFVINIYQNRRDRKLQQITFLRQMIRDFECDPQINNVLKILSFEEYQEFQVTLPERVQPITFRPTDQRLCEALVGHDKRASIQQLIVRKKEMQLIDAASEWVQENQIQLELRSWFKHFFDQLSHFESLIKSDVISTETLRPWIIRWLQLIADRQYKRIGGSKFYDQLYTFIHCSGYHDVEALFRRYGYRILASPYQDEDLKHLAEAIAVADGYSSDIALICAKAAYLAYEDMQYITEISQRWQVSVKTDFRYFNSRDRDTQAYILRTDTLILLVFRGSQQLRDWQTNFSTSLRRYVLKTLMDEGEPEFCGHVHNGFELAWESVEMAIIRQIQRWQKENGKTLPIYVTGHSLGGALATLAAAALLNYGFNVQGLYTFGQPRVGDWRFVKQLETKLQGRIFRFVNNNDVVPHVPPPFLPWNLLNIYVHAGQTRYFTNSGRLVLYPNPLKRLIDFSIGLLRSSFEPGFDLIVDHRMEFYVSYLNRALQLEKDKARLKAGEADD
ncbi:MAG: lipase family protein [Leptolyngbyaceae cyanobacterium SL_1_1]|nr:lipase family protein [Leptolyngbyaceae cyanobacterium RM1_1_2]NJO10724.1 lipase family protein [Leptolyngbyaceae cyanobacterium SL_1_1]